MRRSVKLSLLGLVAAASACNTPDLVVPTEILPYAGVRFINAVPDSAGAFGLDFRFVDILESNAHFRITFRNNPSNGVSTAIQYKGAREGTARHFKIFLDDTLQSIATVTLADTQVNIQKQKLYTALLWGNGRATTTIPAGQPGGDQMALRFFEENEPQAAAGKVKLRVINTTGNTIDAWAFLTGTAAPALTSTPTWDNIAPYTISNYVEVDTATIGSAGPPAVAAGNYTFQIRNDGAGTTLFANSAAIAGARPSCSGRTCTPGQFADIEAAPGTRVEGSHLTAIVFPRSTAGSRAPQATAFTSPAMTFTWDKRPPRTCDPYC